jgi:hypothetical protein
MHIGEGQLLYCIMLRILGISGLFSENTFRCLPRLKQKCFAPVVQAFANGLELDAFQFSGDRRDIGFPNLFNKLQYLDWESPEAGNAEKLPPMAFLKGLQIRFAQKTWVVRAEILDLKLHPQLRALRLTGPAPDVWPISIVHDNYFSTPPPHSSIFLFPT